MFYAKILIKMLLFMYKLNKFFFFNAKPICFYSIWFKIENRSIYIFWIIQFWLTEPNQIPILVKTEEHGTSNGNLRVWVKFFEAYAQVIDNRPKPSKRSSILRRAMLGLG